MRMLLTVRGEAEFLETSLSTPRKKFECSNSFLREEGKFK